MKSPIPAELLSYSDFVQFQVWRAWLFVKEKLEKELVRGPGEQQGPLSPENDNVQPRSAKLSVPLQSWCAVTQAASFRV